MDAVSLNPAERRLSLFMWVSFAMYGTWGLTCMCAPVFAEWIAAQAGALLVGGAPSPLQPSFWEPLADGAMASLVVCSFCVAKDPRANRIMVLPILASKFAGTAFAAVLCLRGDGGPSIVAMLVSDLPLLLITAALWRAAGQVSTRQ